MTILSAITALREAVRARLAELGITADEIRLRVDDVGATGPAGQTLLSLFLWVRVGLLASQYQGMVAEASAEALAEEATKGMEFPLPARAEP